MSSVVRYLWFQAGKFLSTTLTIKGRKPQAGGGGRGPLDHHDYGGGGGGGRGDGAPDYGERLRRYRLGMAIALVAVVTTFIAFTTAFLLRQNVGAWDPATDTYVRNWKPVQLPTTLLIINTLLLCASSVTLELARRDAAERALLAPLRSIPGIAAVPKRLVPWLEVTVGLGFAFLAGQALAWRTQALRGLDMYAGAGSSFFYILSGTHALHLFGGLLALLYAVATTSLLSKPSEVRLIVVDITAWYWHVMALLWVYIFALLALSQ